MVDCSHGNSHKDHRRQAEVVASICQQAASGSWQIFGAMLESHLVVPARRLFRREASW
jgi:3-deoxy-7-phosphoheptulonate synthase